LVIVGQVVLAIVSRTEHWKLWELPWWVWLIPIGGELALLIPLAWHRPRRQLEQMGHRRTVALALLALISFANALLLLAVIASLAFSPTDAMALSRRAKLLMLAESGISSLTVLLVAARAVNIFK